MNKLFVEDVEVQGKRVLVRVDFNVPLDESGEIIDDGRIRATLPTIENLVSRGARVILMSHLGRPKGKPNPKLSLAPVSERLGELLRKQVRLAPDCVGPEVKAMLQGVGTGDVLLLENLRFHKEETKNDSQFGSQLAELGDLYVNDAFGAAHRAHASTASAAAHFEQRACGYLLKKELDYLGGALDQPRRPFVAVIGGAKISGKIDVIQTLLTRVDTLVIGGGMSYTFFRAMGREVGESLVEESTIPIAEKILATLTDEGTEELLLPIDCVSADNFDNNADRRIVSAEEIPADRMCLDIGPKTIALYTEKLHQAQTVVWNGPMGVFEMANFATGTNAITQALVEATKAGATTIVGGGDSAAAVRAARLDTQVSHVSTGGGASLEFLEGKKLPGVEILSDA